MILNVFPNDVFLAQWQLNQQFFSRSDPRYNHLSTKKGTTLPCGASLVAIRREKNLPAIWLNKATGENFGTTG